MTITQLLQIIYAGRKKAALIAACIALGVFLISFILPAKYTAESVIAVDTTNMDPVTGLSTTMNAISGYMSTQAEMIQSQRAALIVVDKLKLESNPALKEKFQTVGAGRGSFRDWLAAGLLTSLDVVQTGDNAVLTIRYKSGDSKYSATVANAFSEAYVQLVADSRMSAALANSQFFEAQLNGLQKKVEKAQQALADYQSKEGIVDTDERVDVETQHLNDLSSQVVDAQAAAADAHSRARSQNGVAPDVLNNSLVQQLKIQIAQKESEFKDIATRSGPNHPLYQQLKAQLDELHSQLDSQIKTYGQGLKDAAGNAASRQSALLKAMEDQKRKVMQLKSHRSKADILAHDVENAQRSYDGALQRLAQTSLQSSSNQTNVTILKMASEPLNPSFPNIYLNTLLGIVLGVFSGIAYVVLSEAFRRRIHTAADIHDLVGIPVLATIQSTAPAKRRLSIPGFR
ncbi:chain length determinant protein EpsF [Aquitalea sp. LB_tupeE]|uniref:chain length determinant protein EpsF n=1 Tax=Aquitalea sp. LB_tupeE TaxID=2748078 RepID=UPI0015C0A80F|nr:chain length determinant protein EpsF [Aquitalea sp. LB_tupeE]NWK79432.1 chain length determinant protein EpsF [Aquitalea sp. LB_tupeE]